jgi:hypothetical protein
MSPFRFGDDRVAPPPQRASDVAITRFENVYEVDPELMIVHVSQQPFANWDTQRIVAARNDHLGWMHRHWASTVVPGSELLGE